MRCWWESAPAGPPGIAAASPVDCVRVQAAALVEDGRASALVCEVADHWLPEVAEERYLEVAGALGVHESEVRAAVDVLRADTTPYVALPGGPTRSAPTDVVFTHPDADGPVVAHVADAASAGVGMVPDLLPGSPDARAWLAPHRAAPHDCWPRSRPGVTCSSGWPTSSPSASTTSSSTARPATSPCDATRWRWPSRSTPRRSVAWSAASSPAARTADSCPCPGSSAPWSRTASGWRPLWRRTPAPLTGRCFAVPSREGTTIA